MQKPFDNPKVREAINYAINRQALVKVALPAMPPGHRRAAAGDRLCAKLSAGPYDPEAARELLRGGLPERFQHHAVVLA